LPVHGDFAGQYQALGLGTAGRQATLPYEQIEACALNIPPHTNVPALITSAITLSIFARLVAVRSTQS
jgi:hypothetical protein